MSRFLITSALPYINGIKHLGNLAGSMLPADFYARFLRQSGHEVLFLCATDEHGTPAELAAAEAGLPIAQFCAEQHAIQDDIYRKFDLSWDYFGRSSSNQNRELTQHFARKLWENGFLDLRETRQLFSKSDGRFLPDRYVIGICPHCGYDRARGDQCENCTRLLDPTELKTPRSAISGTLDLEIRSTKHLYLKQGIFSERIRAWLLEKRSEWPDLVISIGLKWLDEGLSDRAITRDLIWGIPVNPSDWGSSPDGRTIGRELDSKVFYVWFDAPIEYIGSTQEWCTSLGLPPECYRSWWIKDEGDQVTYTQFMAKDNVPFHTVGFPITILGSGEAWKLADYIKGFNWLQYYGGKFSTSQKRGIFMDRALDEFPSDYYRYWLLANSPEGADANFTWANFVHQINKDLADVLGNFVNRTLTFCETRFEGVVPSGGEDTLREVRLRTDVEEIVMSLTENCTRLNIRKALSDLRMLWVRGNTYINEAAPWESIRRNRDEAALTIRTALNLIRLQAVVSMPVIPSIANHILTTLAGTSNQQWPANTAESLGQMLRKIQPGQKIGASSILVPKIKEERIAMLEKRYGR